MKFCNMAVVVPVDQLTGSKAALSAQVWGQVSNLLMPALGKLYRQFHPANDAWGHKLTSPFGVVLGCQEPELFLTLFLAADTAGGRCISRSRHDQKGGYGQGTESGRFAYLPRSGRWQRSGADDSCAVAHFAAKRRAAPRLRDLLCRPRACGRISRGTAGDSVKPCRICPLRRAAQPGGGKR